MKPSSEMNENNNVTHIKPVLSMSIIDEELQTSVSLDVEDDSEALKPSTISVPQTEDKIIEENEPFVEEDYVIPDDNSDELLIEASHHGNDVDVKLDGNCDELLIEASHHENDVDVKPDDNSDELLIEASHHENGVNVTPDDNSDELFIEASQRGNDIDVKPDGNCDELLIEASHYENDVDVKPDDNSDEILIEHSHRENDVDVKPDDNSDELLIEASQHENDLNNKRDESADITLSEQTSITLNPQHLSFYETDFFVRMVTAFLSKSCLHYLLSNDEMNLTKAFMNLDPFGMIWFVSLYWLHWKWHKVETIRKYIHYNNCESEFVENLLKNLEAKGFILTGPQMNFDEFLEIATTGELKELISKFPKNLFSESGEPKTKTALIKSIKNICNANNNNSNFFIKEGELLTLQDGRLKKMRLVLGNYIKIHELAKRTFNFLHSLMYLGANPKLLRDKKLNWMLLKVKDGKKFYPAMELECDLPSCIFPSRLDFLEYEQAYSLAEFVLNLTTVKNSEIDSTVRGRQILDACRECHNSFKIISQREEFGEKSQITLLNDPLSKMLPWLHPFTPGYQYVRAMELSVKELKTFNTEEMDLETLEVLQTLLDQTTYRQHKRAHWYSEQTSILQMRQHDFTRVAEILILALNEPSMNEDEKAPLRERAENLATQKTVKIDTNVIKLLKELSKVNHIEIPSIDITAEGDFRNVWRYYFDGRESGDRKLVSVEEYALLYYQNNSDFDCGQHWKGRFTTSIFNLLFRDIIYRTVKDKRLFLSHYQEVPLDMYTPYFYENRKELIDERLAFIKTSRLADVLHKMKTALTTKTPGDISLHSNHIVWKQLLTVSRCLGNAGLHSVCKRLAHTYHYAQSGFPNLTIWNSKTNQIKFVEVKGEGDKLSFKQIQWIHYLMESNVSSEVCYVHRDVKKYRKKMSDKLKASIAVTRDTDDNQNRKKIKIEDKSK